MAADLNFIPISCSNDHLYRLQIFHQKILIVFVLNPHEPEKVCTLYDDEEKTNPSIGPWCEVRVPNQTYTITKQ